MTNICIDIRNILRNPMTYTGINIMNNVCNPMTNIVIDIRNMYIPMTNMCMTLGIICIIQ